MLFAQKPETARAKMSAFCSFCVHHVALNGEAVKSNVRFFRQKMYAIFCTKKNKKHKILDFCSISLDICEKGCIINIVMWSKHL